MTFGTELQIENSYLSEMNSFIKSPELGRQRQAHLCEFKASLVYRANAKTVTQRNSVSKQQKINLKRCKVRVTLIGSIE